jgi:signal transduction histidine kinase
MQSSRTEIGEETALGRKTPVAEMPRAAIAVRWVIAGVGFVTLLALLTAGAPAAAGMRYLALFVMAIVLADALLLVRIAPGSYLSIAPAFIFVYFVLGGATAAAAAAAAAQILLWLVQRLRDSAWQTAHYAVFNAGQQVLAVLFAGIAVQFAFGIDALSTGITESPVSTIVAFAFVYLVALVLLMSLAVYSLSGFAEVRNNLWPSTALWTAISVAVSVPFAIVNRLLAPAMGGYVRATIFTFAVLAGIAAVVRLNVKLRYGNEELQTINTIGRLMTATLELPEIFGIVARETRNVLFWDTFFIALGGKRAKTIQLVFLSDEGKEISRRKIPAGVGMTGRAISTGDLAHFEHGRDTKRSLASDETFRGARRPRSVVIAPMKFGEEVLGAICLQSYQTDVYGPPQHRLLQTIAAQAAIAVRNAQLFESEKQAKDERDEFLSLVTHEIKNPLTSIRGYAGIAHATSAAGDVVGTAEALRVIEGESAKILRLTEDLLDASRMTAGRFSVKFEDVDLGGVVMGIVRKYEATTTHRFDCAVPEEFGLVEADPIRLAQVIENLVSNAVKYSQPETTVTISLRSEGGRAFLSIGDKGNGIPPERLAQIFERFYRVEEEGSSVPGTGLGLFISQEIVRMHGGTISVESQPGRGSTFTVELPLKA